MTPLTPVLSLKLSSVNAIFPACPSPNSRLVLFTERPLSGCPVTPFRRGTFGEAGRSPSVTLSVVWLEPRTRPKGTVSPGLCSWSTPPSVSPLLRSVPSIFSTTSLPRSPARSAGLPETTQLTTIP